MANASPPGVHPLNSPFVRGRSSQASHIIPAILAKTEAEFFDRLKRVESLASVIQIDVMDGHFVPNATWFDPLALVDLKTPATFELHLMVSDPTAYIGAAQHLKTVIRAVWHIEVAIAHDVLINWCHKLGWEAGLAISPDTPIGRLAPFAEHADEILILGVQPGFSAQPLIESTIDKAREIHERWPSIPLAFDGGVTAVSIPRLRDAGVTRFCAASAIFGAKNPNKAFEKMARA